MNKHCYRIIFNRARNQLMVVSEITRANQASASGHSTIASCKKASLILKLKPLILASAIALGQVFCLQSAMANPPIVVDQTAPAKQQPQLVQSNNGTPQINIQTPNNQGVSHNKYNRFDVDNKGVILNNSRNDVNTQLGGYIAGNQNLVNGEARVILNEINANDPSKLNGYIEVAGKKAQVIIANAAGISCDSCGFINANKATLTTGKPIINNDKLQGYQVEKGKVHITGKGMDTSKQDYTEIIARSVEINAGLWANNVTVVTGRNNVSHDLSSVTPQNGDDNQKPMVAIDIANLGGMYAGKIRLIGTEQGVGVNNAGKLGAQAGSVVIQSNGYISNSGNITASQDINLKSRDQIDNKGTIYSKKDTSLHGHHVKNSGTLAAAKALSVNATNITQSAKGLLAAGVNEQGQLTQNGQLTLNSQQAFIDGSTVSSRNITLKNQKNITLTGSLHAKNNISLDNLGDSQLAGKLYASTLTFLANNLTLNGQITAIEVTGQTDYLSLSDKAEIKAQYNQLTIDNHFTNRGLIDGNQIIINTHQLDNLGSGRIYGDSLNITATTLNNLAENNQAAVIAGRGNARIAIDNQFTNRGLIDGNQTIINAHQLDNLGSGRIYGDTLVINATTLNNLAEDDQAAVIAGREKVMLGVDTLNNQEHALIYSAGDLSLYRNIIENRDVETGITNFVSEGRAGIFNNISATFEAANNITISVSTLNNINNHFSTQLQEVAREYNVVEYRVMGRNTHWREDELLDKWIDEVWHIRTKDANKSNDNYYSYHFDRITYETQITETDPAKLLAGGTITLDADVVLNDKSQITAGNLLNINAKQLSNVEVAAERHTVIENGKEIHWFREKKHGKDKQKQEKNVYAPAPIIEQTLLKPSRLEQHVQTDSGHKAAEHHITTQWQTVEPEINLPNNSLYQINPSAESHYLIETDPRFTQYKEFLSSDYILKQYKRDPNIIQKRLGDGFYEQQLIREQISALTGQRYLAGQQNDEDQYRALMQSGLQYAQQYNLSPGVALTHEQMANLTNDMVWLVSKEITLPNGQIQQVLVPQVYLRTGTIEVNNSGALLSGKQVALNITDDLNNNGRISALEQLNLQATNINQTGGIMAANQLIANASDSINISGGTLQAINHLDLQAGKDITLSSTLATSENQQQGYSNSQQYINNTGGIIVHGNENTLNLEAGHDITLKAGYLANLGNKSQTQLTAGNDITLSTVTTEDKTVSQASSENHYTIHESNDKGSEILSNGNVTLTANHNVNATAATVDVSDKLSVNAGNSIMITTGESSVKLDEHQVIKSSNWRNKTTEKLDSELEDHYAESSQITGGEISMNAGNALHIKGSQVAANNALTLNAGGALTIDSAEETSYAVNQKVTKKSGMMSSGGIGATFGSMKEDIKQTDIDKNYLGSTVGSISGNVTLTAGNDLTVKGSDIIAGKDISMNAENISLESLDEETRYHEKYKMQKSGLTLALTGTINDVYTAAKAVKQSKEKGNDRITALQSVKAAMTVIQALQDTQLQNDKGESQASIGISIMGGTQITQREINQEQHSVKSSSVTSGGNINMNATGRADKTDGDITLKGSTLKAANDISLQANRDINVIAAVNTQHSDRNEKSYGGNVGIGLAIGGDESGIRYKANANFSNERERADGSAWTESIIDAGNNLKVNSGHDTNLIGGQLKGERVDAIVGHDLNIQSLQDTDDFDYEKLSTSISGTAGTGFSGNLSLSSTKIDSNWASVVEQSGIFAGKGGYSVYVDNNTDLKGAVIASKAEDKSLNSLDTGTLSFSNIQNKADFDVTHISIDIGTGASPSPLPGMPTVYHKSDRASSTTASAVEQGALVIRNKDNQKQNVDKLSRDTEHAHKTLEQIFDKQKELDTIETIELIKDIASQVQTISAKQDRIKAQNELAKEKEKILEEAKKEYENLTEEQKKAYGSPDNYAANIYYNKVSEQVKQNEKNGHNIGGMGSSFNKGVDTATAIVTGILTGDITGGLAAGSAPWLAGEIKKQTGHYDAKNERWETDDPQANLIAHAILGAAVAQLQGNSALAGATGAVTGEIAANKIREQLYNNRDSANLSEDEKKQISALSQLASGIAIALATGGDVGDAGTAVAASKNAVENNYLSVDEAKRKAYLTWIKPNWKGEELTEDEKKELENLNKLDKERDQILLDNCSLGNISSSACKVPLQEATEMQKEYAQEVARGLTNSDLYGKDSKNLNEALKGLDPNSIINLIAIEAIAKETGQDVKEVAQRYRYVMAVHGIVSSLAGVYGSAKLTSPSKSGVDTIYHVEEAPNTRVIVGNNAGKGTAAQTTQKWSVDPTTQAADKAAGVLVNGVYKNNPTAQNITGLLTDTGRIGSKKMNGQFMYVVDQKGNIIIGTRSGERMPHPTLIGGKDPQVLGAGIVDIRAGKIYSIDNASGHYKPGTESLNAAKDAFGKLPEKYFSKDFQGYKQYDK